MGVKVEEGRHQLTRDWSDLKETLGELLLSWRANKVNLILR